MRRPGRSCGAAPNNPAGEFLVIKGIVQVRINGETRDVANQSTLEDLVRELSLQPQRIAIELNHNVVRRNEWSETVLSSDDRIEIVHFVGGGLLEARL